MPDAPISAARFSITVDGYEFATFKQLAGLKAEVETVDYVESTDDLRFLLLPAGLKPPILTLSRPRTSDTKVRAWYESSRHARPSPKKLCLLSMYDAAHDKPVARYYLENAWPAKYEVGPHLTSGRSQTWESVTLRCDGARRA